ncbi:oxidoreductase, zinc-binding dehydrogenase family protein [Metarhizium guizhouense ARSEF 977]|uniref:Oxidoreductase, zinc-binding dehydrogenase family protein n=1 Tax=Metarhizium guizhouense (strain ARSEF 977) TaxID=1276136 RepID=A0A0B4GNC2_METGA|nr:oxidoreductase, zinc-binding dehydrogenase family protein [Metarhizium guizhouense ARSEF 977]
MEECGGLCETWFTALQALHLIGRARPGQTRSILWHAGSSAVSIAGIQLSQVKELFGESISTRPRVFATARRQGKCDFCVRDLGCRGAINLAAKGDGDRSWTDKVRALNDGGGIDLIVDFLGGPSFEANLDLLAVDGCIVQLGILQGPILAAGANISGILLKRARIEGSTLRGRDMDYQVRLRHLFEQLVLPGLVDGRLRHVVERVLPWQRVGEAHELIEMNETKGKLVCVVV